MKVKSALYAAVGAPVVAARKVGDKTNEVYGKLNEKASGYSETANKAIDGWAVEGEKVVVRVKDGKVVDEITSKVDLDQAKEQVSKLRDQLEDMLATWRSSFRPEKANSEDAKAADDKSEEKKESKPAAKTAASKSSSAKTSTAKSTAKTSTKAAAAKTSTAKSTTAKTTTAKTGAAKTSSAKEEKAADQEAAAS